MLRIFISKTNLIKHAYNLKKTAIPIIIFLILASISFMVYYSQSSREIANIKKMVAEDSANIKYTVELQLHERLSALQRMAERWSVANGTPKNIWQVDAQNYIKTLPGLKALEWFDSTNQMRWVVTLDKYKNKSSNALFNKKFTDEQIKSVKKNDFIVTSPFILPKGNSVFLAVYEVKAYDAYDGLLVGVFDIKEFFSEALSHYSNQFYTLSLSYNGIQYYSNKKIPENKIDNWIIDTNLKLFDKQWTLTITPNKNIIEVHKSLFPFSLLVSGLLFSLLVSLIIASLFITQARIKDLAKANYLINTILQSTYHLIIATDVQGTVTLFNKASEKALGYNSDEIIGKHTPSIWHDSKEVVARAKILTKELGVLIEPGFDVFVAKAQRGITETLEWTLIRKDGSRFPVRLTPTTLKYGNQIIGYLGVLEDITKQQNDESEIRELKRAMENAIEGAARLDISGKYTYVNEAYAKTIGCKPEDLIGQPWENTVYPDDRKFMISEYKRMLKVGKVSPEVRGIRKDGSVFYKQLTMISNINEKGDFKGHFCFMKDISERKENERKTALLATIVEFSEDAMISKNLDGTITAWNKGAENLFGYLAKEMIGKNIKVIIPPEKLDEEKYILESVKKGKPIKQMETIRISKDNKQIDISLTVSPIFDKSGNIIGVSKVARDISKRKQQEKEMELLTDKLLASNTELDRFAYIASHDLQEPIRMITNFSQIISKDYANVLDDDGKEYLNFVINAGNRMRDMIDDLLSYSRLSNYDESMNVFKGESIIREVQENLKTLLNEKNVKITHDKLPELYGNPVQILRLLQNLITNAIKYQPTDNIPKIHVSAEEDKDYWRISVKDNGLGIKEEFINVIFKPFKRLHTWDSISGTGLGLAICKKIIENHGGSIEVKSEFGKGSIFTFSISKKLKKKGLR